MASLLTPGLTLASSYTPRRRALLFPLGNSSVPPNDSVSIYLDYADPKTSDNWHACAQFALVLSNATDPTNFVVSRMSFVVPFAAPPLT